MAKTVKTKQIRALSDAMHELSDSCQAAMGRMEEAGVDEVESSNYQSALRGFELILRFVNGVAGTATTARSRALIAPVMDELQTVAETAENYKSKGRSKNKDK